MAERRMFAKSVIISDNFLDMSVYAQYLYFMLGINADDDGFVGSPKTIMRQCAIKNTAFNELIQNNYIIPFDSGVIAIRHWKINNQIRKDRYIKTVYINEWNSLVQNEKGIYNLSENICGKPTVNQMETQYSIVKDSIVENSILPFSDEPKAEKIIKHKYGAYKNVLLSDKDIENLKLKFPNDYAEKIENLSEGLELKGYKYKNHYLAIIKWSQNEVKNQINGRPDLTNPDRYKGDIKL